MATSNMHIKFQIEILQQTWVTLRKPCRLQTDGRTDRQTYRRTRWFQYTPPTSFDGIQNKMSHVFSSPCSCVLVSMTLCCAIHIYIYIYILSLRFITPTFSIFYLTTIGQRCIRSRLLALLLWSYIICLVYMLLMCARLYGAFYDPWLNVLTRVLLWCYSYLQLLGYLYIVYITMPYFCWKRFPIWIYSDRWKDQYQRPSTGKTPTVKLGIFFFFLNFFGY